MQLKHHKSMLKSTLSSCCNRQVLIISVAVVGSPAPCSEYSMFSFSPLLRSTSSSNQTRCCQNHPIQQKISKCFHQYQLQHKFTLCRALQQIVQDSVCSLEEKIKHQKTFFFPDQSRLAQQKSQEIGELGRAVTTEPQQRIANVWRGARTPGLGLKIRERERAR